MGGQSLTEWHKIRFGTEPPWTRPEPRLGPALPDDAASDVAENRGSRRRDQVAERASPEAARARTRPSLPPDWASEARGPRRGQEGGVPLSAIEGRDQRPFGEDFAIWYRAITSPRLPAVMRAETAPEEDAETPMGTIPDPRYHTPSSPYAEPLGIEGGARPVAAGPEEPLLSQRRLVGFEPLEPSWDARTGAGIRPRFDPTREWAEAERRAGVGAERPARYRTWVDPLFAAVFGRRGGR